MVALRDGKDRARDLVQKLEKAARQLKNFPDRGHAWPELVPMGIQTSKKSPMVVTGLYTNLIDNAVHLLVYFDTHSSHMPVE